MSSCKREFSQIILYLWEDTKNFVALGHVPRTFSVTDVTGYGIPWTAVEIPVACVCQTLGLLSSNAGVMNPTSFECDICTVYRD